MRGKAVGILLGTIVLLGSGLAFASRKPPKKYATKEELEEAEEDIELVMPDSNGNPGKGGTIKMSEETAVAESDKKPTNVDDRLEILAAEDGKSTDTALKEVVTTVTKGVKAPPLAIEEISEKFDPNGSVKLARLMLVREELPNWKNDNLDHDIAEWQKLVGIRSDDMFGPESAARMAEEVGILPLIRYWPNSVSSKSAAINLFKSKISGVINKLKASLPDSQAHIDALTASMNREKAVTFGNNNPPTQNTRAFVMDINDAIAEGAELQGEKELKS